MEYNELENNTGDIAKKKILENSKPIALPHKRYSLEQFFETHK